MHARRSALDRCRWLLSAAAILLSCARGGTQRVEGQLCDSKYGGSGVCLDINSCPSAVRMVRQGMIPDICGFRGTAAVVCCEEDSTANQLVAGSQPPRKPQRQPSVSSGGNIGSQFGNLQTRPSYQASRPSQPSGNNQPYPNIFQGSGNFRPESQYRPTSRPEYKPENNGFNTQYRPESTRPTNQYRPDNRPTNQYRPDNRPTNQYRPDNRPTNQYRPDNRPTNQYRPDNRPTNQYRPDDRPTNQYRPDDRPTNQYRPGDEVPETQYRPSNNRPGSQLPTSEQFGSSLTPQINRSISEKKCDEYARSVTETVEALPLLPNPDPVTIQVKKCDFEKLPLIVGGEKTVIGEFPHMAAIGYKDGGGLAWNCGGSLISEYYVLTAAHCTHTSKGPPVIVRLGELNLKRDDDGAHPVDYPVTNVIRHPEYRPPNKYNDIALLRLGNRVHFNKFLRPACLYTHNSFSVNKTVATGWGRIDYAEKPSDLLLKVVLDIIDNGVCNDLWQSSVKLSSLSNGIVPSMMCAGVLTGGKDTCQGDSGGPIQISSRRNQCVYYVIGVTSFGKFCAAKNAPGVYTRVSYYIPWIESVVWPDG